MNPSASPVVLHPDLDVEQKESDVIVPPPPMVPPAPRVSPPPPSPLPPSPSPRQKEQLVPLGLRGQRSSRGGGGGGSRGYGVRGGRIRAQMFEDPAVVRTVEGRPSIKVTMARLASVSTASVRKFSSIQYTPERSARVQMLMS